MPVTSGLSLHLSEATSLHLYNGRERANRRETGWSGKGRETEGKDKARRRREEGRDERQRRQRRKEKEEKGIEMGEMEKYAFMSIWYL